MKNAGKWTALLLCAALLAGCSLARPEESSETEDLAGVFVRYLPDGSAEDDFFEYDEQAVTEYLESHASGLGDGEFLLPDGLGAGVHVLREEERDQCILFGREEAENEEGPYTYGSSEIGAIFSMAQQHIRVTDEGESIEASAEVYIDAALAFNGNGLLDINPVYRRADGALCVAPDSGFMGSIDDMAKTISAESTQTDGQGKTTKRSISIGVSVKAKPRVIRATLIEMNERNRPIASREIDLTRETLTETVSPGTAWVLVEACVIDRTWDEEPREKTVRTLVELEDGKGETTLMLPTAQEGLLAPRTLTIG